MTDLIAMPEGGFAYLRGGTQPFSHGVVALEEHALIRVRLRPMLPLAEGLAFAADFIAAQNRPQAALAALEVRSPAAMSPAEFAAFNTQYAAMLDAVGFAAEAGFPIARSNMAPQYDAPRVNTLFAFTFATPSAGPGGSDFVISGKPENTDGPPGIVASGDLSPAGMQAKAAHVITALQDRVAALGASWHNVTGAQAYTIHSLDPTMGLLRSSGLANIGLTLFPGAPPVTGFAFEIDVRAVSYELVVQVAADEPEPWDDGAEPPLKDSNA